MRERDRGFAFFGAGASAAARRPRAVVDERRRDLLAGLRPRFGVERLALLVVVAALVAAKAEMKKH